MTKKESNPSLHWAIATIIIGHYDQKHLAKSIKQIESITFVSDVKVVYDANHVVNNHCLFEEELYNTSSEKIVVA